MRLVARLGHGGRRPRRLSRRALLPLILAAASLTKLPVTAAATEAASDAAAGPIAELQAGLLAQMKAGRAVPFATRYARLAPLIERVFDLPFILRVSVGQRWTELAEDDRTRLLDAFRSYTVSSYATNFDSYRGERFVILPDKRSVEEKVVVATEIVPSSGTPTRLDYVLRPEEGEGGVRWKAIDVLLDGSISQVAVQRSEFQGLLAAGGAAKLIAALRRKTADLAAGAHSAPAGTAAAGAPR